MGTVSYSREETCLAPNGPWFYPTANSRVLHVRLFGWLVPGSRARIAPRAGSRKNVQPASREIKTEPAGSYDLITGFRTVGDYNSRRDRRLLLSNRRKLAESEIRCTPKISHPGKRAQL